MGVSAVDVKSPRVSDVPAAVSEDGCSSQKVRKYERTSRQTQELFRKLCMEGLSARDFGSVFREFVGETTALSANVIVRLKSRWEDKYREWRTSHLDCCRYAYIWADGVYPGAGVDRVKTALLCVVGMREDGETEAGRGALDEATGKRVVHGVQGGTEPLGALAPPYGSRNLMSLLMAGARFEDGVLVELPQARPDT